MTPQAVASQAPLFVGFSRQEHWSGQPFPSPGDFPDPGVEPRPPALQADSLPSEPRREALGGKPSTSQLGECLRAWKIPATEKQGPGLPHAIRGKERGQRERENEYKERVPGSSPSRVGISPELVLAVKVQKQGLKLISVPFQIFFSKIHLAIEEQPPVFLERFVFPKAGFS